MTDGNNEPRPDDTLEPIRVLIVHDHRMFAEGLRLGLDAELDISVIGVAGDTDEADLLVRQERPDVAVVEWSLAGTDGLACGIRLKIASPELKVLLLTGHGDPQVLNVLAISAGFDGLLHRQAGLFEAVHAVRRVGTGGLVFAAQDLSRALHEARRNGVRGPTELTEREAEVFQLLAEGLSTTKMAATLYLSPHTVRTHVARILAKLETHSKGEAVAVGYRRGLISPP